MPGDPLRAQWIAENFLSNVVCVNRTRGMLGFTGLFKGKKITVMASGMGIPSVGIYSYELMHFYKVNHIIRIGTCGALTTKVKLGDIIIAENSYSDSTFPEMMGVKVNNKLLPASARLVDLAKRVAKINDIKTVTGIVVSQDAFYQTKWKPSFIHRKTHALAAEMESFGLYTNAIKEEKNALAILTVCDSIISGEAMTAEERQNSLVGMVKIGLDVACRLIKNKTVTKSKE